jgi:hypothetical protein
MAPHIMSEATSVDAYATLWPRGCHSLVGRMGTASSLPNRDSIRGVDRCRRGLVAAAVTVTVKGNRTVSMMWSDTAKSTWALLRVSTGPETISELGSAGPRTCSAISMAPHIMSEATSVNAYATLWRRWCHLLVGRMGKASVFARP